MVKMNSTLAPEVLQDRPNELPVIKFSKEFLGPILSGNKVSTTRKKPLDFRIDGVVRAIFPGETMTLKIVIADMITKKFKELNKHDAWLEGYNNIDDLKDTLKKIYPNLRPMDKVYIYRFALVGEY